MNIQHILFILLTMGICIYGMVHPPKIKYNGYCIFKGKPRGIYTAEYMLPYGAFVIMVVILIMKLV